MTRTDDPTAGLPEEKWARDVFTLHLTRHPTGALNLNVEGRQVVNPLQGFGQLWQKTYRIRLTDVEVTPAEVIQVWKSSFQHFLPPQQRFYPESGMTPGKLVLLNVSLGGLPISTGMMVLYADDESFTLMTPQGHPESGWNTFSAYREDHCTVCQVQSMARANDPLYEIGFRLLGSRVQEMFWCHVLKGLSAHFQTSGQVEISKVCLDRRVQWSSVRNIWQNAALHTFLHTLNAPVRWLKKRFAPARKHNPVDE